MYTLLLALLLTVPAFPALAQTAMTAPKEAAEPIMKQLEAFRRGDFDTASAVAPNGHAYLSVKIRGANGNSIEAIYELVLESGQWKINGVTAKPDPGLV